MRIFLADDSSDVRLALQMLIDAEPCMEVIGIAVETDGLLIQVLASRADVLLLDCDLPGELQSDLVAEWRAMDSTPKVIALSVDSDPRGCTAAYMADDFFCKMTSFDELLKILRTWRDEMKTVRIP